MQSDTLFNFTFYLLRQMTKPIIVPRSSSKTEQTLAANMRISSVSSSTVSTVPPLPVTKMYEIMSLRINLA